jgi:hypothetical protein
MCKFLIIGENCALLFDLACFVDCDVGFNFTSSDCIPTPNYVNAKYLNYDIHHPRNNKIEIKILIFSIDMPSVKKEDAEDNESKSAAVFNKV